MSDFSPSFLLSGLIEFSVLLPSDHPIYILLFVDIVTITNLFFTIHIHHEEMYLYISRILRILSLYFSARIVFYLCYRNSNNCNTPYASCKNPGQTAQQSSKYKPKDITYRSHDNTSPYPMFNILLRFPLLSHISL